MLAVKNRKRVEKSSRFVKKRLLIAQDNRYQMSKELRICKYIWSLKKRKKIIQLLRNTYHTLLGLETIWKKNYQEKGPYFKVPMGIAFLLAQSLKSKKVVTSACMNFEPMNRFTKFNFLSGLESDTEHYITHEYWIWLDFDLPF